MKIRSLVLLAIVLLAGCKSKTDQPDAYGNFETTEVTVSSEANGKILRFIPIEGSVIEKGTELALIDTTILSLQKGEIYAGIRSIRTKVASINSQNEILNQQIENLMVNISRFEKMVKDNAATQKQLDDLTGQKAVFEKQISANNTQKSTIAADLGVNEARINTLNEQLKRSSVKSPLSGTIIEKYAEEGEITATGKPLAKIANMSVMKLKVYVSGSQIGKIKLGQKCKVRIDDGNKGYKTFAGTIEFVSEKAEFTPKIIQTKEERVTLVYAVNIEVMNDGSLKAGMPGEAIF